jgi:hypothetical protein
MSPIPIIPHPLQPRIEEVVVLVKYLFNPNPLVEGDASFNHFIIIPDNAPSEHERFFLSSSTLPPSPKEVPFD